MKIIKIMVCVLSVVWGISANATEDIISLKGKEIFGYNQPYYHFDDAQYGWKDRYNIVALVNPNNFPVSSYEQGSVFTKIFDDLAKKEHIVISFYYPRDYQTSIENFEKKIVDSFSGANTVFGVYYENIPYSKNEYIYPTFFENQIHIITAAQKKANMNNKEDLKNYKGVYAATDNFSSFILKEFANLGIKQVKDFPEAYKALLSGEADYIAGSYYPGIIEAYKLGIRDYVVFSKDAVWKIPMFIRAFPEVARHPRIAYLKRYFKSQRYKKIRDEALQELVDIYKENTKGIVPPTYIKIATPEISSESKENAPVSTTTDSKEMSE